MRSNIVIIAGLLLSAAIVMSTVSPVRLRAEKTVTHRGVVAEVYETALKDFVVKLKGRPEIYYLDNSDNESLNLEQIKTKLIDQPVSIQYADRWKAVSDQTPQHYVSKLEIDDEIVYSE